MAEGVDIQGIFSRIVRSQEWGGESGFGEGATLFATERLRAELPDLLGQLRVNTILDAGCGGLNWVRHLDYEFARYIGLEIVDEIIAGLKFQELPRNFSVRVGDLLTDVLPLADAVLCRDCLTHFSDAAVRRALFKFKKSGARYLIATTWPHVKENHEIATGSWRPLNLQIAPFFLPRPIHLLTESELDLGGFLSQKALGIWELDSIVMFDEEDLDDYLRFVRQDRNYAFITRSLVVNRSVALADHELISCGRWDKSYKLIQFWDAIDPPRDVRNLVEEWKTAVPQGCHILFNDQSAREFISRYYPEPFVIAYDACGHPAMKSDYFRYAYLYVKGGLYVDADEKLLGPMPLVNFAAGSFLILFPLAQRFNERGQAEGINFSSLIDQRMSFPIPDAYFANSPIIACPRHPVLKAALIRATRLIMQSMSEGSRVDIHDFTGPNNLTYSVAASILRASCMSYAAPELFVVDWGGRYSTTIDCEYKTDSRNWRNAKIQSAGPPVITAHIPQFGSEAEDFVVEFGSEAVSNAVFIRKAPYTRTR